MPATLTDALVRSAERHPDREAVRFAGAGLTWHELARKARLLARALRERGVRTGDRVGIHAGKGLHSAVAIHGIMGAGAAYVPLDPAAPEQRIGMIARDCGIRHVVTEPRQFSAWEALHAEGLDVACLFGGRAGQDHVSGPPVVPWEEVEAQPEAGFDRPPEDADLSYVLYTSGSTGTPKGVTHTHASALAFARAACEAYGLGPEDRVSNHAPLHFDLSTLDFFAVALAGGTTVIIPEAHTKLPASLAALMETERLTVLYAVPLALTQLLIHGALETRDLSSLRWVLFGGEPFPPKHLRALMERIPHARFSNVYGPTEVNGVTYWILPDLPDPSEPVPIGVPYRDVHLDVVDGDGVPVARGEPGELWVRTPTMMQGYWGRPDRDLDVFDRRPGPEGTEDIRLKTGDLVRERPDGALLFLGRKDRQIKARGYRVELDEVEFVLAAHPEVEIAAVFSTPDGAGSQRICAAVCLRADATVGPPELMAHAATTLPPYALPEDVEILIDVPRTTTGKVDRRALAQRAGARLDAGGVR